MHQSVIVNKEGKKWKLVVLGGKESIYSWTNKVEYLDLTQFFNSKIMPALMRDREVALETEVKGILDEEE
jgi:hypothetical protein